MRPPDDPASLFATPNPASHSVTRALDRNSAVSLPQRVRSSFNRIGEDRNGARRQIKRIVHSYDSFIIRTYCRIRFVIMRLRFLEEIDQYIPREGNILDFGCGFGLFSLYFASCGPHRTLSGVDLSTSRIAAACRCAARLRLVNVQYTVGDAVAHPIPSGLECAYMLDLIHHLPEESVRPLLSRIRGALVEGGTLLIKDVDARPAYKRWFTLALDRLMVGMEPIRYWPAEEMIAMLEDIGFRVYTHDMRDVLPYPHRLYICRKK